MFLIYKITENFVNKLLQSQRSMMKLDTRKIQKISKISKEEQWPYPKTFTALKEAGVESYEVEIAHHKTTYFGGGKTYVEETQTPKPLEVSPTFNSSGVEASLRIHQAGKTDFPQFLDGIAKNGVYKYIVDMSKRTVSYMGLKGEMFSEAIP